jgi:hypothetical protein
VVFNTNLSVSEKCLGLINQFTGCMGTMIRTSFTGFNHGILASQSGISPTLSVTNSIFTNNINGITVNGINYHKINHCLEDHFKQWRSWVFRARVSKHIHRPQHKSGI